ncbi:MAG TPA: LysM peptidoglycan-binding domain-containing protein [Acidimicrobiales bacterium]|nr:LysM peptidoglycan-binding domain-containing protein [Acidimicrobiales bacterium]
MDIAAAACAALLAFTAVPAVLVVIVGNPLGGGLGHAWRPLPHAVLCLLVVAAWVAWVACCAQLLRAVVAHVRRGEVGTGHGSSVLDRLAARIAFGVLALTSIGTPLSLEVGAGASTPAITGPASSITTPLRASATTVPTALPAQVAAAASVAAQGPVVALGAARTYTVQPGDTLWRIADDLLGDGADWTSLAALNLGRHVGTGVRFVDPDQLREGWHLQLPAEAGDVVRDHRRGGATHRPSQPDPPGHLPELLALGLGSVACAALARRAGHRRRLGPRFNGDRMEHPVPSEGVLDTATLLQRFAGAPALHSFEAANCLLGLAVGDRRAGPKVRAICVSPSGVTFWLAGSLSDDAPEGFDRVQDGNAWFVSHDALHGHEPSSPYLPVVLPVGDDAEGTWFIPLEPGDVLPLLGEAAPALWRAARAAVGSWAWSDTIVVTEDPDDEALRDEPGAVPHLPRTVLFCGDPAVLSPPVAARCAVITMEPVAATDLTLLVDRQAATVHPMGLVVRPHLQSAETAGHVAELVARPVDDDHPTRDAVELAERTEPRVEMGALSSGTVEVRLLTMTPRIDRLREDLPPNRARRATELVAYLALHQPDVITSDRLRTRVLGSSDADAASKTLFNTAYAARRALGVDDQGDPLFPAGSRDGLYQLSPQVTVDAHRAVALAAEGRAQTDPDVAIAYLRSALELVEGEPLANALSGYAWWEAEGHGGRVAAALVDAACIMASLASDTGRFELARWGLERARLLEPYSEALSRAAMQVAAAEGDADRLRLEWRDCQRRIDALDPGGSPSARTESLYGELSRRVLVGTGRPDGVSASSRPESND